MGSSCKTGFIYDADSVEKCVKCDEKCSDCVNSVSNCISGCSVASRNIVNNCDCEVGKYSLIEGGECS